MHRSITASCVLACLGTVLSRVPTAAGSETLCVLGDWPFGPASEIALDPVQGRAFFQSGRRIVTIDISDPSDLHVTSTAIEPAARAEDLFCDPSTQRLYMAVPELGLETWDVADSLAPARLSIVQPYYYDVEAPVLGVVARGDNAYVTTTFRGVTRIDVTDPEIPVVREGTYLCGTPPEPQGCNGSLNDLVFAEDGVLYATSSSNKARMNIEPDGTIGPLETHDVYPGGGDDIFIGDGTAFLIRFSLGLQVYDIASSFPRFVFADEDARLTYGVATFGTLAYVATGSPDGLVVMDFSDPYNLTDVAKLPTVHGSAIQRLGTTLYLVGFGGLTTLDISLPDSPMFLDQIGTQGFYADQAVVAGSYAFTTGGDVNVLDISDPTQPAPAGRFVTQQYANGLNLDGNLLFVVEQALSDSGTAVTVLDVTDPAAPAQVSRFTGVEGPAAVVARNGLLFVAEYPIYPETTGGLRVIDYTNPSALQEAGYVPLATSEEGISLEVVGDYAYVGINIFNSPQPDGIRVIDVSDPSHPQRLGFVAAPGPNFPKDLASSGGLLYAAFFEDGVVAYDLATPATPVQVGRYYTADYSAFRLKSAGRTVYVAGSEVRVLDLTDPAQPVVVATEPTPRFASGDVALDQDRVVAVLGDLGARIFGACGPLSGDLDGDGDIDLDDSGIFAGCLNGPAIAYPGGCQEADFNGDGYVDMHDFAELQVLFEP